MESLAAAAEPCRHQAVRGFSLAPQTGSEGALWTLHPLCRQA